MNPPRAALPLAYSSLALALALAATGHAVAHTIGSSSPGTPSWFRAASADTSALTPTVNALNDNGTALVASFGKFAPKVRFYWDATTFYVESEGMPLRSLMPEPMVGITSWQQQIPLPTSYFTSTTNPEKDSGSLGYGKTNVWRIPLSPSPAASPIPISSGNFQRGAIALAADGIAIFNPRNNTGRVSYEIGELDAYGGHCGLADDYHYHIAPVHLQTLLGTDKPIAWALDGYPIYGYTEPDGSARLALDADGGHSHGNYGYHYHAVGSASTGPQSPYLPAAFHGTVVNYGGQVDGQPEVSAIRASGTGGYNAQPISGAKITAFKNPVALDTDGSGHLVESLTGTPSPDQYLMRYTVSGTSYDLCWRINRTASPKTLTITFRAPATGTTTTTYNSVNNRLTAYEMAAPSLVALPDTGQTTRAGSTFGQDADYSINVPSFTDNGNGTVTDNITKLVWQKTDAGESTWENALARASSVSTGGFTDWRLPTPAELFSLMNHNLGAPALDSAYFPASAAEYWWTTDNYGTDATRVWCVNAGGGLGPKPKSETLSAGGTLRYHARYVRGAKPSNARNLLGNLDGTVTDPDNGLMWTQAASTALDWNAALAYAENLTLAGYSDWRLPNVKELQSLIDFKLATATSASGAVAPLNPVLFPGSTTPATAYWSSTVLVHGSTTPTSAWLVEFGVNNSVPAANGPARNAQGIVSYEIMTATHPVLAVRNTNLTPTTPPANVAPSIASQPSSVTVTAGQSANFSVTANGSAPLSYQWKKGGSAISGATSSTYSISSATTSDAGNYTVEVTNPYGSVTSNSAALTVNAAPAPSGGSTGGSSSGGGGGGGAPTGCFTLLAMALILGRFRFRRDRRG